MARDTSSLGSPFSLSLSMANSAGTPSFRGNFDIFFVPLMAVLAVGCRALFGDSDGNSLSEPASFAPSRGQNLIERQASFCTLDDSVSLNAASVGKFDSLVSNPLNIDKPSPSLVSHLLFPRSPKAIIWRISSVIVSAFDGVPLWARSHVIQKVLKRTRPPLANSYPAPSVIWKSLKVWVKAPSFYTLPYVIERMRVLEWHKASLVRRVPCHATRAE